MKECPYCAEEIKDKAIICSHCGRDQDDQIFVTQLKRKISVGALREQIEREGLERIAKDHNLAPGTLRLIAEKYGISDVEPENRYSAPGVRRLSSPVQTSSVVIKDIEMEFGSMVWFMVKWAIASIPAIVILAFGVSAAFVVLAAFGLALGR